MPPALYTLLWLNARAGVRRMGRQARSVRGVVFLVIGVFVAATWVVPTVFLNGRVPTADPSAVRAVAPVAILGFCVLNLISSAGERAVTFSPAEVDFLFPGPFTRRQLLAYKLLKTGLGGVLSALIFGLVMGRYGGSYWGRVVGIWLTFQFMQMLAMVAALVQTTIGERVFTTGRRWVLAAVLAVVVVAVAPGAWANRDTSPSRLAGRLHESPAGRVLLAPFAVFGNAITARRLVPDALRWDGLAAVIDGVLVGVVLLLDANYLETAATASAKRYDRVARLRRGGVVGLVKPTATRFRVPMLPWLGGAGPVAWRQLTGVLRTSRGLLVMMAVVAVAAGGAVAHANGSRDSIGTLVAVSVWANLFLASLLKFDFRGDLDHLDVLRSLPLRPTAVAAAELVAPTVVLSAVQGLLLAAVGVWGHVPAAWLAGAAAFVVPANALLVGTENLLFLLFPFRQTAAVAGDMGMVGRQSIVFLCRLLVLVVAGAISAGVGAVAYWVSGRSWPVAAAAAWVPLAGIIGAVTVLLGLVYDRFDPSVDTPT